MAKTYNTISTFTSGQVLTAAQMNEIGTNSNNYRVPPMCSLTRTAALSQTATATYQPVAWDTEKFTQTDTGMWSAGSNPSRINLTTAGVYYVTGGAAFAGSVTGLRATQIQRNGVTQAFGTLVPGNSAINYLNVAALIESDGTQYVELAVYQDTGGNFAYTVGAGMLFSVAWLGQVS
jgi:hypothetical protein